MMTPLRIQWKLTGALIAFVVLSLGLMEGLTLWTGNVTIAFLITLAISGGLGIVLSHRLAGRLTDPLRQLMEGTRRLIRGEVYEKIRIDYGDEMTEFVGLFNEMALELESKIGILSRERTQLETILSGMVEGVLILDGKGTVLMINTALEEMFRVKASEIVGRSSLEVLRQSPLIEFIKNILDERKSQSRELEIRVPDERWFQVQASVPRMDLHQEVFASLVFHDMTEIKRLERVRRDFVANASHEIRTPLTAIKGYIEALMDGAKDDPKRSVEFLEVLRKHADRLNNIVEDLLTLAEIESGRSAWKHEPIKILELLDKVVSILKPAADRKKQELTAQAAGDLPVLNADSEKLTQVLTNLVDNAIKYTSEKGKILIEARPVGREIEISVSDTGIGIPPQDVSRIFERFYRVDRARSRELGGTGLGLSIVKHIVEAHAGTVSVKSHHGKGTKFIVNLPVKPS